jgi:hypothetical protein
MSIWFMTILSHLLLNLSLDFVILIILYIKFIVGSFKISCYFLYFQVLDPNLQLS